ncbi:hypothetical protein [Agrobacterium genomosp. 2]|nr:hypothetical protein [Agrobacterium genomosp. 2]
MSSDRYCADGVMMLGYLGDERICYVADYGPDPNADGIFHLFTHSEFPGRRFSERWTPCDDLEHGQYLAEAWLLEWMADVGFVPKAEFDEARKSAEHFIRELRASSETNKRRLNEIRDLRAENTVLKERIGSAFGDIDDAIAALKRKVDDIVADTGVARTWSWDVPVDQRWKGAKPKGWIDSGWSVSGDIGGEFSVIFRDGGAA